MAEAASETREGYAGRPYREVPGSELSGMSPESYWLTPDEFARMRREAGFREFRWLTNPQPDPNGGLVGQFSRAVSSPAARGARPLQNIRRSWGAAAICSRPAPDAVLPSGQAGAIFYGPTPQRRASWFRLLTSSPFCRELSRVGRNSYAAT